MPETPKKPSVSVRHWPEPVAYTLTRYDQVVTIAGRCWRGYAAPDGSVIVDVRLYCGDGLAFTEDGLRDSGMPEWVIEGAKHSEPQGFIKVSVEGATDC